MYLFKKVTSFKMFDIEYYYSIAANEYENSNDAEYHFCNSNSYRFFMIEEYAKWLFEMNETIRIWE